MKEDSFIYYMVVVLRYSTLILAVYSLYLCLGN